jgi:hypothetical protein
VPATQFPAFYKVKPTSALQSFVSIMSSESRIGLSCFSGVAIVGQTGAPSTKTVILDVEVFLGAKKHSTLLGSLRFFNTNNIRFGDFPDGMACLIKASVGFFSSLLSFHAI